MATKTSRLGSLTKEQLNEAFVQTTKEVDMGGFKLVHVTEDVYDEVVKFAMKEYVPDEPISIALDCTTSETDPDWEQLWLSMLRCNLSLALKDDSGSIIGMRIACIGRADEKYEPEIYKHRGFQIMFIFCKHCDEQAKWYEHFGTEESFHFFGLATGKQNRHHHIATHLMEAAVTFVKNIGIVAGIDPVFIKGEGSSNFSKRCYETNNFETLYEKFYDDFKIDGKQAICNTGDHKSLKVYGRRIDISKQ